MANSSMPGPRVPFVDQDGLISSEWYRWLAAKEKDASAATAGSVTAGAGLSGGGIVSSGVTLRVAAGGVTNAMLRDSQPFSVVGRHQGTTGVPADIVAAANNRVLARIGGVLAFYDTTLIPATVADGDKGDITVSGTGTVWTIDPNVVSNAKLAQVPTATFKGRTTAATGNAEDLTATQATALLNAFTTTLKGLAPASGGGTANYLRADGTWAAPPGTTGTVTTVSVVTANGFSGTVANPTTTPAITLSYTFTGGLVRKAANQVAADYTTATAIAWDSEVYDTAAFHDNVTNNTRITIPAGVSKVRLRANIVADNLTADMWFFASIRKGGVAAWDGCARSLTETGLTSGVANLSSSVVNVSAGDYFEVFLQVETDNSIDIQADSSWFSVEVVA